MTDCSDQLVAAVAAARGNGRPLYIRGGDSKRDLLGRECTAQALDISGHRGVVDYQPRELVVTARAGTPVAELAALLAAENQVLPFEPPLFAGRATLGGSLACNLSGPGRPWRGSVRDAVLGVQLVNGQAQLLRFGGRVIKNVAGYDVARLQGGALGTLGVITEVTVRVLPAPERQTTLCYEMDAATALDTMLARARQPKPLSAALWLEDRLYLRLSGAASAVAHTAATWGGEELPVEQAPWTGLREMTLPFFAGGEPLWRLSVDAATGVPADPGACAIDWGGAQRWLRGDHAAGEVHALARRGGGHALQFRGGDRRGELRDDPGATARRLHQRLKRAFDPDGIFNPGRLYGWL